MDGFPLGLISIIGESSLLFGSCFFWCLVYSFMLVDSSGNANNRYCCLSWTLCIKIETITMLKGYRIRKYCPLKDENIFLNINCIFFLLSILRWPFVSKQRGYAVCLFYFSDKNACALYAFVMGVAGFTWILMSSLFFKIPENDDLPNKNNIFIYVNK